MNNSSDAEILTDLEKLERMINQGVSKVDSLLKEAWSNKDLQHMKEEISQARQELETARNVLQQGQDQLAQDRQRLDVTCSNAVQQRDLLKKTYDESENLYLELKAEEEKGRVCLDLLMASKQESQQCAAQLHEAIRRVETAEDILAELDDKYSLLVEVKNNLMEIIHYIDGYNSIGDLMIAIREATERLKDEQMLARTMIEELGSIKRTVNVLVQAQRNPWWWPSNWWWKQRSNFSSQRIRYFK